MDSALVPSHPGSADILQRLPSELHIMVLENMHSLQDIYNTISASPTVLRVFTEYKTSIMWKWLEMHLGPDNLRDAVLTVILRQFPFDSINLAQRVWVYRAMDCWHSAHLLHRDTKPWLWKPVAKLYSRIEGDIDEIIDKFQTGFTLDDMTVDSWSLMHLFASRHWRYWFQSIRNVPLAGRMQLLRPYFFGRVALEMYTYAPRRFEEVLAGVRWFFSTFGLYLRTAAWHVLLSVAMRRGGLLMGQIETSRNHVDDDLMTAYQNAVERTGRDNLSGELVNFLLGKAEW